MLQCTVCGVLYPQVKRESEIRAVAGRRLRQVGDGLAPGVVQGPAPAIDSTKLSFCGKFDPFLTVAFDAREANHGRRDRRLRIEATIVLLREYARQIKLHGARGVVNWNLAREVGELALRSVRVFDGSGLNLKDVSQRVNLGTGGGCPGCRGIQPDRTRWQIHGENPSIAVKDMPTRCARVTIAYLPDLPLTLIKVILDALDPGGPQYQGEKRAGEYKAREPGAPRLKRATRHCVMRKA